MTRLSLVALTIALVQVVNGFTVPSMNSVPQTALFMADDNQAAPVKERGVSFDQDGKSNVWAIEPKVEISTKSGEEQTKTALIAGGGLVAAAVAAAAILTNLPDPNQF
ncbi:hypothetical protein FisN_19Hh177 [Fistulifera solaris]|uniref:Uncharacterized protein n=1 Tax=Fistulifera solaris TaxID=1519565 RepID=A0A1Z5K0P4_FISSO|nr:hypothetical protein FisN_19Hh177 [Fistulifera solaris]|eukprot:GAX19598.1 hypothetical protein FisN_19Hh177 [Fistulifera solaris]